MKTKAQIVQGLLNKGNITAEDAVVLLTPVEKEKEYIFIPQQQPYYPQTPYDHPQGPWYDVNVNRVTCNEEGFYWGCESNTYNQGILNTYP